MPPRGRSLGTTCIHPSAVVSIVQEGTLVQGWPWPGPGGALAGLEVEYVKQREVVFDGVVYVAELARGRVRVARTDELPEAVIGVVTHVQNRLRPCEDLARLDAGSAQQPMLHPPRAPVTFHDTVHHPPDER